MPSRAITPAIEQRLVLLGINPTAPDDVLRAALATTANPSNVRSLLGGGSKTDKNWTELEALTSIIYMSPAREAGVNLCPMATVGCAAGCLGHSTGNLRFDSHHRCRVSKALLWWLFPATFLDILRAECRLHVARARALGVTPAIRLNGSTDIRYERHIGELMEELAADGCRWYDYTKWGWRARESRPACYHLTYSISERPGSWEEACRWMDAGGNAALVVAGSTTSGAEARRVARRLIDTGYRGRVCYSMDTHDARWADPPGQLGILYAKGAALSDASGFVHRFELENM